MTHEKGGLQDKPNNEKGIPADSRWLYLGIPCPKGSIDACYPTDKHAIILNKSNVLMKI